MTKMSNFKLSPKWFIREYTNKYAYFGFLIASAIKLINKKNVVILDANCGCGYGASLLINILDDTTVKIETMDHIWFEEQIIGQTYHCKLNDVELLTKYSNLKNRFDFILCFDLLNEIQDPKEITIVLDNLHKMLATNGKLIISVQNNTIAKHCNKTSKITKQYTFDEILEIIKTDSKFFVVEVLGQGEVQTTNPIKIRINDWIARHTKNLDWYHIIQPFNETCKEIIVIATKRNTDI